MNNYSNIVLFFMALTLSYLIMDNAYGAGTPDSSFEQINNDANNSSFSVIGGGGNVDGDESSLNMSFPMNNESLHIAANNSVPASNIGSRRSSIMSSARSAPLSSIHGRSQFSYGSAFGNPMEESVVDFVIERVPSRIMPRAEVQAVVSSAFREEPAPIFEYCCDDECDNDECADEYFNDCVYSSDQPQETNKKLALIRATKEHLKADIVKLVEAKKEHIIAEVISYEIPASSKTLSSNMSYTNFDIETRMDSLSTGLTGMLPTSQSGVSSGETIAQHGIWWQFAKSRGQQKETSRVDSFSSTGNRVIVGYDILTEKDNSYGLAYSLMTNTVLFKVGGSAEDIRHHNYSFYSSQTLTDKLYVPVAFSYGNAAIKTKRDMLWKKETVRGKTKARTYNAKVGLAYNVDVPRYKIRLTPQMHLVYEEVKVKGFIENGARISTSRNNVLSSILSVSIAKEIVLRHTSLIPELQYSYKSKVKGKAKNIRLVSTANDDLIAINSVKLNKYSHVLTSGLTLSRSGVYSYSLGHQYTKSQDKYTSHTGYFKLRITL